MPCTLMIELEENCQVKSSLGKNTTSGSFKGLLMFMGGALPAYLPAHKPGRRQQARRQSSMYGHWSWPNRLLIQFSRPA